MAIQVPPDSTGKMVDTTVVGGNHRQNIVLSDAVAGLNLATVAAFHNTDNQAPGSFGFGLLTGGSAQFINIAGNLDRQRETAGDNAPSVGITSGAAQFKMLGLTNSASNILAGTRTIVVAAASGTINGISWAIQVGSVLIVDSGASQEKVWVTAVAGTSITAVFANPHNGSGTAFTVQVIVFNEERDAAGELDGASGAGTAVAAEYMCNSGGAGTAAAPAGTQNFDRTRNLQGKGAGAGTIASGGGIGSVSVTLGSAPTGLQPGAPIVFLTGASGTAPSEIQYTASNYVAGSNPVLLANPLLVNHGTNAVAWDVYAPAGPGLNGFQPIGIGVEEEVLFDPVSNAYYIERSATQDGVAAANVVMEGPALWNGATMDRGRSASAANVSGKSGVGVELTAPPGNWSVFSTPNAATQATASQAAGGAGVRHVCTSISATLAAGATAQAAAAIVNLRDGATGAGTILWSKQVILPTNGLWEVNLGGLAIVGSAATAMTLEFSAAGAAGTFESVAMTGYDVS